MLLPHNTQRAMVLDGNRKSIRIASLDDSLVLSRLAGIKQNALSFNLSAAPMATFSARGELNLWTPVAVLVVATVMLAIVMWNIATSDGYIAQLVRNCGQYRKQ